MFNIKGKTLMVKVFAISELRQGGHREVFFELNRQLRSLMIQDKSATKNISKIAERRKIYFLILYKIVLIRI